MIDLSRAIFFVQQNGTILEKARLLRLLMDVTPTPEAYQKLIDSQNPDGGFPSRPKPGSQSAVDSTLTALWQFDELGLFDSPSSLRALDFLTAMQQPDGGLDENPALPDFDLPPWIVPGELGTRLYLSAYAAYWLAVAGRGSTLEYQKLLDFLGANQRVDGGFPSYMHTNWLASSVFLLAGDDYALRANHGIDYLSSIPFSEWDDSQIAWALDCLTRAGLLEGHPFIESALAELEHRQAADGCWASEDGPSFAASATVGVLKVLKQYNLLGSLDE